MLETFSPFAAAFIGCNSEDEKTSPRTKGRARFNKNVADMISDI